MSLSDGRFTFWQAMAGENAVLRGLPDGSILLRLYVGQESVTLYRLRSPGRMERLGTFPRRLTSVVVSSDLRRAAVRTLDAHGDAWMSTVVRP